MPLIDHGENELAAKPLKNLRDVNDANIQMLFANVYHLRQNIDYLETQSIFIAFTAYNVSNSIHRSKMD